MTIPELVTETTEELADLKQIIDNLIRDVQQYPKASFTYAKLTKLEHCYETLKRLNGTITELKVS
jgi:hypothetical protein